VKQRIHVSDESIELHSDRLWRRIHVKVLLPTMLDLFVPTLLSSLWQILAEARRTAREPEKFSRINASTHDINNQQQSNNKNEEEYSSRRFIENSALLATVTPSIDT